jgi:hypothetical protein
MVLGPGKTAVADLHSFPKEAIESLTGNDFLLLTADWHIQKKFTGNCLDAMDRRELILQILRNEAGKNI